MATKTTPNTDKNPKSDSKKGMPFDDKAFDKSTDRKVDRKVDKKDEPKTTQFQGSTLDQGTYGDTGTNTTATGSGASGGFGSTGGSELSGSSDYSEKKDYASDTGINEYRSPSEMSSASGSFSGVPSGTSADTRGDYGNSNLGAKAGVGDNGAQPVSGGSSHAGSDSGNVTGPGFNARSFGTDTDIGTDRNISGADSSTSFSGSNVSDNRDFGKRDDTGMSAGGTTDSSKGGDFQSMILKQIAEIGDLIERAGERIEKAGFSRIGDAIFRLGDKLEHLKGSKRHVHDEKTAGLKADDSVEVDGSMRSDGNVSPGSMGTRSSSSKKSNPSNQASGSDQSQAY